MHDVSSPSPSASSESHIMSVEDEKSDFPQLSEETLSDLRELCHRCKELLDILSSRDGARVEDQKARFNIWAANMGVFRGGQHSIASRLSSAPEIIRLIHQLLVALKRSIEEELSRKEHEEESSSDSQSDISSDRSPISSNRRRLLSTIRDAASPSVSRAWTSIEYTITSLDQLAITIRQAGNQHRQERTEKFKSKNELLYESFRIYAKQQVQRLFPNASTILQERMAHRQAREALEKHIKQHFITVALILVPIDQCDGDDSGAQREKRSEPDPDEKDDIYELKCLETTCDCNDEAKDSPVNWSSFDHDDDPSYRGNVDIQDEWKFSSDGKAWQDIADDDKLREYFKIETLTSIPEPKEASEGEERISIRSASSQFHDGRANQNVVIRGIPNTESIDIKMEKSQAEILQELRAWLKVLNMPEFISWRSVSSSPKSLWLHGLPGFGKTTLCARIIEYIKTMQQEIVAFHFFSPDDEHRKDPMAAMRSWIYHMALQNKSVASIINRTRESTPASQTLIIELFRQAIKMESNCTLVIDGLDDCFPDSSRLSVTEFIEEVNDAVRATNTRILVTSLSSPKIRQVLMELNSAEFSEHEVCAADIRSDIEALSKVIVAEKLLRDTDENIQTEMAIQMSDRSNSQFSWLKLQQDCLPEGLNQEQLQYAWRTTPDGYLFSKLVNDQQREQ
ncbi:hypothetical protein ACQKWADRAFT_329278 [Trichoderma austrokoningii]